MKPNIPFLDLAVVVPLRDLVPEEREAMFGVPCNSADAPDGMDSFGSA